MLLAAAVLVIQLPGEMRQTAYHTKHVTGWCKLCDTSISRWPLADHGQSSALPLLREPRAAVGEMAALLMLGADGCTCNDLASSLLVGSSGL